MKPWNALVTSLLGQERDVYRELRQAGNFMRSDFKDVFIGWIDDMEAFLCAVLDNTFLRERIGKVVPIEHTFTFHAADFEGKLEEALLAYLPRLAGSRFHVRMERRGFKGRLNSLEIEQEMDRLLKERLDEAGKGCEIDFEDPDHILVVETVAAWCGVSLITREMKERYPFIKVK
jgi:tRNA(Ser,Leu) C12 N-acetylase TAN1